MLHVALLCLVVGQVPPPPVPHPPESPKHSSSFPRIVEAPPSERLCEWLLAHLTADLQAQGKLDARKYHEIERMVNNLTAPQVVELVQHYQQQLAQAQANLRRLEAYRDSLKRERQWKIAISRQEQAQGDMQYSLWLAAQQVQWAMGTFYAAQPLPYYVARPYYYAPYPRHHHHW